MRKFFRFQPRNVAALMLLGGVLLTPLASHGCDAKGASPKLDTPAKAVQAIPESPSGSGFRSFVLSEPM
jgi:hypothetical protein